MSALRSSWQIMLAWLVVAAVGALFYFAPLARLVDGLPE
jgi:hypothetical protein